MLVVSTVALLVVSAFATHPIRISLHPPGTSDPNDEVCAAAAGVALEVSPTISTYSNKVTPCICGDLMSGSTYLTVWMSGDDEITRTQQTFESDINYGRLTGGKRTFNQIFRPIMISNLGNDFQEEVTVSVYECLVGDCSDEDIEEGVTTHYYDSATLLINRPEQQVGYAADNLFAIRTSEPSKWRDCREDSDSVAIADAIANGDYLYICVIYMCPFMENVDLNNADNDYATMLGIEVNSIDIETKYESSTNAAQTYAFVQVHVDPSADELTVTATMDSFGGDVLEETETHDF